MIKPLAALLLTVLASCPAAAGPQEAPVIYAKLKPKVGTWAEYSYEAKSDGKTKTKGRFRMAVVDKDGEALWVEQKMTMSVPKPKSEEAGVVMKMLMSKEGVSKAYMKSSRGVMDMSAMMSAASRRKPAAVDKMKFVEVGVETIEVPAGKFKAVHSTFKEDKLSGDVWVKEGAGPYGMVKQLHRGGDTVTTIELTASGGDAKSEVDEKTAQSGMPDLGAMMAQGSERKPKKERAEASGESEEKSSMLPAFGGMFKKALKQKAGIPD